MQNPKGAGEQRPSPHPSAHLCVHRPQQRCLCPPLPTASQHGPGAAGCPWGATGLMAGTASLVEPQTVQSPSPLPLAVGPEQSWTLSGPLSRKGGLGEGRGVCRVPVNETKIKPQAPGSQQEHRCPLTLALRGLWGPRSGMVPVPPSTTCAPQSTAHPPMSP